MQSPSSNLPNSRLQIVVIVLVGVAIALLTAQHWGMMLSNSDDPWIIRSTYQQILETASTQGRFWLIPINLMAQMPYQSGSWELANTIKIIVNLLVFVSFWVFCIRLINNYVGTLAGLVWLALIDVSPGYYSPFHGFLMMFNLQFAVLFISFIWYLKILDGDRSDQIVVGPYLLFGFSLLAYEPMLFYAGVYPALFLYRHFQQGVKVAGSRALVKLLFKFFKCNWMLAIAVMVYIITFFAYRSFQPTAGRGIDFGGNVVDILLTIYRFSIHGFHIQPKALTNVLEGISTNWNLGWALVYACSIALSCLIVIPKINGDLNPLPRLGHFGLAVIAFYVFCPNLLHGFVGGYRQWAAEDPHYVGNYFSSFALAIAVALGIVHLVGGRRAYQEKILFVLVVTLLATSACDNYIRWSNLAEINRRDSSLWRLAISDLHQNSFERNQTVTICGQNSPEKVSGDDRYWSNYLSESLAASIDYKSKHLDSVICQHTVDFNKYRFSGSSS